MCAGEIFTTQQYLKKKSTNPLCGNFQIGLSFYVLTKGEGVARKLQIIMTSIENQNYFLFRGTAYLCILI